MRRIKFTGETVVTFAESLDYSVSFEPIAGSTGGWCDTKRKQMVVDADGPPNAQLRTLTHEVIHALGVDYQHYSRAQAEVIVDTTTLVVLGGLGLDISGETVPYVAGWGEDGALDAVTLGSERRARRSMPPLTAHTPANATTSRRQRQDTHGRPSDPSCRTLAQPDTRSARWIRPPVTRSAGRTAPTIRFQRVEADRAAAAGVTSNLPTSVGQRRDQQDRPRAPRPDDLGQRLAAHVTRGDATYAALAQIANERTLGLERRSLVLVVRSGSAKRRTAPLASTRHSRAGGRAARHRTSSHLQRDTLLLRAQSSASPRNL